MVRYIKVCDFLVKPYEFKVNNGQKNATLLGGLVSFLIILLGSFYFASVLLNFLVNGGIIYVGT